TYQQRLAYTQPNVELQKEAVELTRSRFESGKASELYLQQARSNLAQTAASIPPLITSLWEANNQPCFPLSLPPDASSASVGCGSLPTAPAAVSVGIDADLLRRRPAVRGAEREAAAQCAQIGTAEADFYPSPSILGFLGYTSNSINKLFGEPSFTA